VPKKVTYIPLDAFCPLIAWRRFIMVSFLNLLRNRRYAVTAIPARDPMWAPLPDLLHGPPPRDIFTLKNRTVQYTVIF